MAVSHGYGSGGNSCIKSFNIICKDDNRNVRFINHKQQALQNINWMKQLTTPPPSKITRLTKKFLKSTKTGTLPSEPAGQCRVPANWAVEASSPIPACAAACGKSCVVLVGTRKLDRLLHEVPECAGTVPFNTLVSASLGDWPGILVTVLWKGAGKDNKLHLDLYMGCCKCSEKSVRARQVWLLEVRVLSLPLLSPWASCTERHEIFKYIST